MLRITTSQTCALLHCHFFRICQLYPETCQVKHNTLPAATCDELLLEFVALKQNQCQGFCSGGAVWVHEYEMWVHEYEIHSHFCCLQELKTVAQNYISKT